MTSQPPLRRRRDLPRSPARQRGIAMLVAILLVALGTIIAADIAYRSAMSARRATATLSFDEAVLVSEAAEALAAYGLKTVLTSNKAGSTGVSDVTAQQPWAQPVGPLEVVPGVTLEANIEDLGGRFNLNWLVSASGTTLGKPDAVAVQAFRKLLELSQVDPKWADMMVDWIDPDNQPQTQGAEDSAYLGQNPPYLAANEYITSTSELLALPGFGRDNYLKIAPYIVALPPSSKLNVCTAKGRVLDAFNAAGTTEWEDEQALAKNRATAPGCFPALTDYGKSFADAATFGNISGQYFKQTSAYFRLSSLVTIGSAEFNLYSLLFLDNQYFVHPIQRSFSPD